jgi:prevent-host-death family protein
MKAVSASEANRQFSQVLREVAAGESFVVVSRGTAVARIVPADVERRQREVARKLLVDRLRSQQPTGTRDWTRDELYAREP